jgi:hypothetical protein
MTNGETSAGPWEAVDAIAHDDIVTMPLQAAIASSPCAGMEYPTPVISPAAMMRRWRHRIG